MRKNHLLIVLFFIMTLASGQQRDYIFGQLVDATQNEPIPFATIRFKDRALGVISNVDGTFKIPIRYKSLGNTLVISCMGFESKEVSVVDFVPNENNIIMLWPKVFTLTEAVVSARIKKLSPREIVKIALNRISQNYPQNPFGLVGYYRDYQIKNRKYMNLNEAIIKVVDSGFQAKDNFNNWYQLYSYRKNKDFEFDFFAKQPYDYKNRNKIVPHARMENDGGNELLILMVHDAIRNYGIASFSFIDNITSDFVETHKFKLTGTTNYNKEPVHEIVFNYENRDYTAEGNIYINKEDFAILKLEYFLYRRRKEKDISYAVNSSERYSDGFKQMRRELIYNISTEYIRGYQNKMFLNYISFYNKILIQRPKGFSSKFIIDLRDSVFKIRVNRIPNNLHKIQPNDFRIRYKNKLIPIKDFEFLEDERSFVVMPEINFQKPKDIFAKKDDLEVSDIRYDYRNITDSLGNKLDERKWEYIHQYREFFTQEIQFKSSGILSGSMVMRKDLPLDSPKQPIAHKEMKNEYWMNTPLQKSAVNN